MIFMLIILKRKMFMECLYKTKISNLWQNSCHFLIILFIDDIFQERALKTKISNVWQWNI